MVALLPGKGKRIYHGKHGVYWRFSLWIDCYINRCHRMARRPCYCCRIYADQGKKNLHNSRINIRVCYCGSCDNSGIGCLNACTYGCLYLSGCFCFQPLGYNQTIAGPAAAGKWSGLQNCFANMAGVTAPVITGFVVDRSGQFYWAFVVTACFVLIGAANYLFFLGPVKPLEWRKQ